MDYNMARVVHLGLVILYTMCLLRTVHCDGRRNVTNNGTGGVSGEMTASEMRVYCAKITRVERSGNLLVKPVVCPAGEEFCHTTATCCCRKEPLDLWVPVGATIGGIAVLFALIAIMAMCSRSCKVPAWRTYSDRSTGHKTAIHNFPIKRRLESDYKSRKHGEHSSRYSCASITDDGSSLDSFDIQKVAPWDTDWITPWSISESLPPPAYSDHSFAVRSVIDGSILYYNKPPITGNDTSSHLYTKRDSRGSVMSWMKTQGGATQPRSVRSVASSKRTSLERSLYGHPIGSIKRGYQPSVGRLQPIPSVRSGVIPESNSTVAASEVIYASAAMSQRGTSSSLPSGAEIASRGGTHVSSVSYNPASVTALSHTA